MIWDPAESEPPALLRPAASVGAALFGAVTSARGRLFDLGWIDAARVTKPVVSVGNLAVGGTGKTPFTALLAERLAPRRVAIVTRGYGRRDTSQSLVVVSKGEGPEVAVDAAGDEPTLLATRTRAAVVVCAERARGARHAIEALGAEVILLDDGFQHRRLARDVDLVLLDAHAPFGNGRLLPRGPLREPVGALARATAVVLNHGAVEATGARVDAMGKPTIEVIEEAEASAPLEGRRVALLSGIARPSRFERTVRGMGAEIGHTLAVRDHAWFDDATLEAFARDADGAALVTTEKDAVRLPAAWRERFEVVRLRHRILRGEDALEALLP